MVILLALSHPAQFAGLALAQSENDDEEPLVEASSSLVITIRPRRVPVARDAGIYSSTFIEMADGSYLYFEGLYLGNEHVFLPLASPFSLAIDNVVDTRRNELAAYNHATRRYNRIHNRDAGLIMGGDTLGHSFLEIAATYGIDATYPSMWGFSDGGLYGEKTFNMLADPAELILGPIVFKD